MGRSERLPGNVLTESFTQDVTLGRHREWPARWEENLKRDSPLALNFC
jgi:hypothetical protein